MHACMRTCVGTALTVCQQQQSHALFVHSLPVVIAVALIIYCGVGCLYITALICEKENAALHSVAVADVIICLSVGLPVLFIFSVLFFQRMSRDMSAGRDVWADLFPAFSSSGGSSAGGGSYAPVRAGPKNASYINSVDESMTS